MIPFTSTAAPTPNVVGATSIAYYNLAVNNFYMQRFDEAERVLAQAEARWLDIDEFQMLEYDLAFCAAIRQRSIEW